MIKCLYHPVCLKAKDCPRKMEEREYNHIMRSGSKLKVFELPPNCFTIVVKEREGIRR